MFVVQFSFDYQIATMFRKHLHVCMCYMNRVIFLIFDLLGKSSTLYRIVFAITFFFLFFVNSIYLGATQRCATRANNLQERKKWKRKYM